MNQEKLNGIKKYYLKYQNTCALVGDKSERDEIITALKKENEYVVSISLKDCNINKDDLHLRKVFMFWQAAVKAYKTKIPAENLKVNQQQVKEAYDFFEKGYEVDGNIRNFFDALMEGNNIPEEQTDDYMLEIAKKNVDRKVKSMLSWIKHSVRVWDGKEETVWKLEKKINLLLNKDYQIIEKLLEFSGLPDITECVALYDPDVIEITISEEPKKVVRCADVMEKLAKYLWDKEAEKSINLPDSDEKGDIFFDMFMDEMRNIIITHYDKLAIWHLKNLRNAYMDNGCKIWLIVSEFEESELLYPETDNSCEFFSRLFRISTKIVSNPNLRPDVVMLACDNGTKNYVHYWDDEFSRFEDGYPQNIEERAGVLQ